MSTNHHHYKAIEEGHSITQIGSMSSTSPPALLIMRLFPLLVVNLPAVSISGGLAIAVGEALASPVKVVAGIHGGVAGRASVYQATIGGGVELTAEHGLHIT